MGQRYIVFAHPAIQGEPPGAFDVVEDNPGLIPGSQMGIRKTLATFSKYCPNAEAEAQALCRKLNGQ